MSIRSPGVKRAIDAARRVGDEQRPRAERVEHAHREARERGVVALVHVEATGERDDGASAERAGDELARMSDDGRRRKAGHLGERNGRPRFVDAAGEPAESGAEDDRGDGRRRRRCDDGSARRRVARRSAP